MKNFILNLTKNVQNIEILLTKYYLINNKHLQNIKNKKRTNKNKYVRSNMYNLSYLGIFKSESIYFQKILMFFEKKLIFFLKFIKKSNSIFLNFLLYILIFTVKIKIWNLHVLILKENISKIFVKRINYIFFFKKIKVFSFFKIYVFFSSVYTLCKCNKNNFSIPW